jgi:GT2 family glycosyltransferase
LSSNSTSPLSELSIVIPALNEGAQLRRTVESLRTTVADDTEIIVSGDGSGDGSADFLRGAAFAATLLEPAHRGARPGVTPSFSPTPTVSRRLQRSR